MKKDELIQRIKEEKNRLFDENNNTDETAEFFQKFQNSFNSNTIENIIHMDIFDFIIAHMTFYSKKYSFQEIADVINQFKESYKDNTSKFLLLVSIIDESLNEVISNQKNKELENTNLLDLGKKDKNAKKNIKFLKKIKEINQIDIESFVNFYFEDRDISFDMMSLVTAFLYTQEIFNIYQFSIDEFEKQYHHKPSEKESEKIFSEIASSRVDISKIKGELKNIERYASTIISADKNRKRKARKELNLYMYIETWLKSNENKKEITNLPKEITQIKNKELSHHILEYVYEHNMNEYHHLKENYDHLLLNSYNQYRLLFDRYGINIDSYNIDITKDIKDVESILTMLYSLDIKSVKDIISIVNDSKIEIVKNIQELAHKGYISNHFVKEQPSIFSSNYLNLISNIELYQSENLSVSNICSMESTLDKDTILIKKNIQILKDYQLFSKISQAQSKNFMLDEQLEEKIDRILELGLETYLQEDLGLLNQDLNSFKRIIVLQRLNIPIDDISQLYCILENQKFVVPDCDIDNYIFDANKYDISQIEDNTISKNDFYKLLEKYQHTKLTYNIDGIFISKNKIQRNLNRISGNKVTSKEQLNSILSNTTLEKEEIETIKKIILPNEKVKKIK